MRTAAEKCRYEIFELTLNWLVGPKDPAVGYDSEATKWNTANPQWMFNCATARKDLGHQNEATAQVQKIADDIWAPGLKNCLDQAKTALE